MKKYILILFLLIIFFLVYKYYFYFNQEKPISMVKSIVKNNAYNEYWLSDCVVWKSEKKENYFIVEVREISKKTENCSGTLGNTPLLGMFKVTNNKDVFSYDIINNNYIKFQ